MPTNSAARRGFSLIELLIVIGLIAILQFIAISPANQARMITNETAVLHELKTIHTAQAQHHAQFGRFAVSLRELGPPPGVKLLPKVLAAGEKDGYKFVLQGTADGYTLNAMPVTFNKSGRRSFYSDETMAVHHNWGAEAATEESPEAGEKEKR